MSEQNTYTLIAALVGLLIGLLIAEFQYRKARTHASHVVPATIVNNSAKIVHQKVFYYCVLLTLFAVEHLFTLQVPQPLYWLTGFAIAGGDVQKLANKFFRL